jgi:hypothetical protein
MNTITAGSKSMKQDVNAESSSGASVLEFEYVTIGSDIHPEILNLNQATDKCTQTCNTPCGGSGCC